MRAETIPINLLENNTGQIEGLPKNPRFIKDKRFEALVKSIKDFPEMLDLREVVAVEHGAKYVVIGGNMRLRACKKLGFSELPCKVLPSDYPADRLREFAIKDNVGFGNDDHDILANEWNAGELIEWGMELSLFEDAEKDYAEKNKEIDIDAMESDMSIKLKYTEADYWIVKEALSHIASTPEQAVYKLLGL